MSVSLIQTQVENFFKSETPEVIAIKGHWGVGKTFGWNKWLGEVKTAGRIGLERYSYVSLFGINSLDDLKQGDFSEYSKQVFNWWIGWSGNFTFWSAKSRAETL